MKLLIESVMKLFMIEINLDGFTFTFWDMFLLSALVAIVSFIIYSIFDN